MTSFPDRVQLSVMRALLGAISPPMRAVTVELHGRKVTVRVFHDGAASPDLEELVSEVDTEIRAAFPAEGADAIVLETRLVRRERSRRPLRSGTTSRSMTDAACDLALVSPGRLRGGQTPGVAPRARAGHRHPRSRSRPSACAGRCRSTAWGTLAREDG
jgi:hypothetical protein